MTQTVILHVVESPTKPHEKEPKERWLSRVCGVPFGTPFDLTADDHGLQVRIDGDPKPTHVVVSTTAERAIRSWIRSQATTVAGTKRIDGAGIIICAPHMRNVLLARKDDKHPNPHFRLKLCFIGGSLEPNETPIDGMLRELYEEVRDQRTADEIATCALLHPLGTLGLTAKSRKGDSVPYVQNAYLAMAADVDMYDRWRDAFLNDGPMSGTSEATPVEVSRTELQRLVSEDLAAPGTHFMADLHMPLAKAILNHG